MSWNPSGCKEDLCETCSHNSWLLLGRQDLVWHPTLSPPRSPKQLPCTAAPHTPNQSLVTIRGTGPHHPALGGWVLTMTGHCLRLSLPKGWCTYAGRTAVRVAGEVAWPVHRQAEHSSIITLKAEEPWGPCVSSFIVLPTLRTTYSALSAPWEHELCPKWGSSIRSRTMDHYPLPIDCAYRHH